MSSRRGRILTVVGAVLSVLIIGAGAAFAYYQVTASGSGLAKAETVNTANTPMTPTVSGRDVSLTWNDSTLSDGSTAATGYTISKTNVTPGTLSTTVNGTCSGTVTPGASTTSCTDTGLAENTTNATTWKYTVSADYDMWQGITSSASSTVSIPGPTLSATISGVTTSGGSATSVTVANYFDNETVTYCIDNDTTSCPTADKTTPATATVPASGGTVTTSSLTIPSGLSAGSHTLYAKGSAGSDPSGVSFNVTSAGTAPSFTSTNDAIFTQGIAGSFNVTTSGTPAVNSITNANFGSCTITSLSGTGVAFNYTSGQSTATITSTTASTAGTYTFCLTASNGVSPNATQTFTLTIAGCGSTTFNLAANTTISYTLIGGGGANGSNGGGTAPNSGGPGGTGAEITGTLDNTTGSPIGLTINVGCASVGTSGTAYADGGNGGSSHGNQGAGGAGGGTSSIEITSSSTFIIVAGGGGGGGGGQSGSNGASGSNSTGTSGTITAKPGGSGASSSGEGGGGGGVGTTASAGSASTSSAGAGLSYTAANGTTVGGIQITANTPVSGGNSGANGSASL